MMTVQAQYIQAGDTLHLGTDATPEDFTAYACTLEGDDPGTVAVDVGEGRVYFRPREWVLVSRATSYSTDSRVADAEGTDRTVEG